MKRRSAFTFVATLALMVTILGATTALRPAAAGAAASGYFSTAKSSTPPATPCTINATASASKAWLYRDNTVVLGWVVQTNADIHNPYVFVGCRIGVHVDLIGTGPDGSEVTLMTVSNVAVAGAYFDPFGNNKAYSWINTPELKPGLDQVSKIRIRFESLN